MKITAGILLGVWMILVLLGKGGFVHLLFLLGLALATVEIVCIYRGKITK